MDDKTIYNKYNIELKCRYTTNTDKEIFSKNNYSDIYGELTASGLYTLLNSVETNHKIFYDLGSGDGNNIFRAVINYNLVKSIGVELSIDRYNFSVNTLNQMNDIDNIKNKIEMIYGDILQQNISNANIIYISNLCFPEEVNINLGKMILEQVTPGTIIFCSKQLYIEQEYSSIMVEQTWSESTPVLKYII